MTDSGEIYPREIILEVTNLCNLKCRHCHFHGEDAQIRRQTGHMAPAIWETLLSEIKEWDIPCAILTHGAGEPLLYPHLEALLKKAGQIPKVQTGFMTNGMLLTPEISRMLLDLPLNSLALSIDGVIPQTHDYFRKNADLKLIESNLAFLIKEKNRKKSSFPSLMFNMVGYPEIMDQEEEYVKKWLPHADSVVISTFRPVGSRKLWEKSHAPAFAPCPHLYNQAVISINGDVGLCCEDINLDVPVGNVLKNGLKEIYNASPVLCKYRQSFESGEISNLRLCRDCHVWGGHVVFDKFEKEINGMKVVCQTAPAGRVYRKL